MRRGRFRGNGFGVAVVNLGVAAGVGSLTMCDNDEINVNGKVCCALTVPG